MSKNTFEINEDVIYISSPDWDFRAMATIRDDYLEELTSVTWSINKGYIYSWKLKQYLHVYIMKKWYTDKVYQKMRDAGCVVDHMDNDGVNCRLDNLSFLMDDENKAKGLTYDKKAKDKTFIALSLFKDFDTGLF